MNKKMTKKEILKLIIDKKNAVQNNYFLITNIINEIIAQATDQETISLANKKQTALNDAVNFAIYLLEKIIHFFIDSLNANDKEQEALLESKIGETLNQLEEHQNLMNDTDLNKGNNLKNDLYDELPEKISKDSSVLPNHLSDANKGSYDSLLHNKKDKPKSHEQLENKNNSTLDADNTHKDTSPEYESDLNVNHKMGKVISDKTNIELEMNNGNDSDVETHTFNKNDIEDFVLNLPKNRNQNLIDEESLIDKNIKPNQMDFMTKGETELSFMRKGDLIETFHEGQPEKYIDFDDLKIDELKEYKAFKESKKDLENMQTIGQELRTMNEYLTDSYLADIENKFNSEISDLKLSNKLLSDANKSIIDKLNKHNSSLLNNEIPVDTMTHLDAALNNMLAKIESTPLYEKQNIQNLENIGGALVKGLEKNLEILSNDIKELRNENNEYKKKVEEYSKIIFDLKNDSLMKEQELNESYNAWVLNNRKLQDLESLLGQQTVDINELDGQKNVIIDTLEKKLRYTIEDLNVVLSQNEELLQKQEQLEEFIRIHNIQNDYSVTSLDQEIDSKSLSDLVENEANRILERKLSEMIDKYRSEMNSIEERISVNINSFNKNKDILQSEFDKRKENDSKLISVLEEKVKAFEQKIKNIESNIIDTREIENRTKETISTLNSSLSNYTALKQDPMNSEVGYKIASLENKINEIINNFNFDIPVQSKNNNVIYLDDEDEINKMIQNSYIYQNAEKEMKNLEEKITSLKEENKIIRNENYIMNVELDESLQKFQLNTNKLRNVENLLNIQIDELEKLNSEKNILINNLEEKINEMINFQEYYRDQYEQKNYLSQHKYNEVYERKSVEELIDKKVNELIQKNNHVSNDLASENIEYENHAVTPTQNNNFVQSKTYGSKVGKILDVSYDEKTTYEFDENSEALPINQSISSSTFDNSLIETAKYVADKPKYVQEQYSYNESKNNNDQKVFNENENILIKEIERLQKENEHLISQNSLPKEIIKEKIVYQKDPIAQLGAEQCPIELLENNEKLKNFEKLLIQIDTEISNLENDVLDNLIES